MELQFSNAHNGPFLVVIDLPERPAERRARSRAPCGSRFRVGAVLGAPGEVGEFSDFTWISGLRRTDFRGLPGLNRRLGGLGPAQLLVVHWGGRGSHRTGAFGGLPPGYPPLK